MNIIIYNLFSPSQCIFYTDVRVILLKHRFDPDLTLFSFLKKSIIPSFKKRKEKKNFQSPLYDSQDPLQFDWNLGLYHPPPASTYLCPPTQTQVALATLGYLLFPEKDMHLHISSPLLILSFSSPSQDV